MTTDPLRCRFGNYAGSVFNRAEQVTAGTKSIVNNQWNTMLFCKPRKDLKIRNIKTRVANGFQIDCPGSVINKGNKSFRIQVFRKSCLNAEIGKCNLELIVRTPVQVRRA